MERICFAVDLKNDLELIEEYEHWHKRKNSRPEVNRSLLDAGNRLFMIMEVNEHYSPERKLAIDVTNKKVQEWEALIWRFQQQPPWAHEDEKWRPMKNIFKLESAE
jgi:L-rhamnose mutarotase